jgi:hypothetical protein
MHRIALALRGIAFPLLVTATAGFLIGYLLIYPTPFVSGTSACHEINNTDDRIPSGFGSPLSFFADSAAKLLIRIACDNYTGTATMYLGNGSDNEFIFKYGYHYADGKWNRVELAGNDPIGPWFRGSANGQVMVADDERGETQLFIAYICTKVGNSWKCGCRDGSCSKPYWQLQEFEVAEEQELPDSATDDVFYVKATDPYAPAHGEQLTVVGNNFARTGNDVYLDDDIVASDVSSANRTTITFRVPDDAEPGYHRIGVDNGDELMMGPGVTIREPGVPAPVIERISPTSGGYGTEVTIYGRNFSTENNGIYWGFGVERGVASPDGTTLKITIAPFSDELAPGDYTKFESDGPVSFPIYIMVANSGGKTEDYRIFNLEM